MGLKMVGDRGHPCLVPFVIENGLESSPEVNIWDDEVEHSTDIAFRVDPLNQNFSSTIDI